jgi:signal transduction histidine kinase
VLRVRLALLVAGSLLVALAGFGFVVDALFLRQQRAQLEAVLERELARVTTMVESSQVGAAFLEDEAGLTLQFVDRDGTVRLPVAGGPALPLHDRPTATRDASGRERLVASGPWRLPSGLEIGTIRLGLDLTGFARARAALWRSLLAGGAALAFLATAVALFLLGRALGPLQRLVRQAEAVDPARPELAGPFGGEGRGDEVGSLAAALGRAMDAIRDRQQAERDALAEVAHELAAPLSVVAGRLRGIEAHDPSPEVRAAREAADELLYTSRDLLTLARGELDRELELSAVDLSEVARGVAAETPGVVVEAPAAVEVLGSPDRLRQLLRNLVRNALQAGSAAREVRIEVRGDGGEAVLEVLDRGPGLPAGDEERVFERHVSGRTGGTGLGLSVAREIARAHDGTIRAERRDGGGARFAVRLPTLETRLGDDAEA